MIAFLAGLRKWAWLIGAGLVTALWIAVKVLSGRLEDAKYEAAKYKFQVRQRKAVDDNLAEVDQTFSHRASLRQQEKAAEPQKVPTRLEDMNDF